MEYVYHGSSNRGLKRIEPHKSTHGCYVYATPEKFLAIHFSKRCGDDLTYEIMRPDKDGKGPFILVENIPGAFDKMYANESSIYTLPADTFKDINTGFEELVSTEVVNVISEEYCENVYQAILNAEKDGLVKIYRYPNKPDYLKEDGSYILDKIRSYKNRNMKDFSKNDFDRLVYLHPELLDKINELSKELGYDYVYMPDDLVLLFKSRIDRQLSDFDNEQFIDSSYISICNTFPFLKDKIDNFYFDYIESYKNMMGTNR